MSLLQFAVDYVKDFELAKLLTENGAYTKLSEQNYIHEKDLKILEKMFELSKNQEI